MHFETASLLPLPRALVISCICAASCLWTGAVFGSDTDSSRSRQTAAVDTIVYTAAMPNDVDLFTVEFDDRGGPTVERLERPGSHELDPTFSRDGEWLVLAIDQRGQQDLFAVPAATLDFSAAIRLTFSEAAESAPSLSADGRWLAYVSGRSGRSEIWLQPFDPRQPQAAAAAAVHITVGPGSEFRPVFSPDGRWLAYSSTCCSEEDRLLTRIEAIELESGRKVALTDGASLDGSPRFSADGRQLFFHRAKRGPSQLQASQQPALFTLDLIHEGGSLAASAPRRLSGQGEQELVPEFFGRRLANLRSVDGVWAAVVRDLTEEAEIAGSARLVHRDDISFYALAASPDQRLLVLSGATKNQQGDPLQQDPQSPAVLGEHVQTSQLADGREVRLVPTHIVFPSFRADRSVVGGHFTGELVVTALDGSAPDQLLVVESGDLPRPPGALGLFGHHADPLSSDVISTIGQSFGPPQAKADVVRVAEDGTLRNLTADHPANDGLPKVSPDGQWIVFRSGRDGNHEIYLMERDGSNQRRLTHHDATDTAPAFAPDGRTIAFVSTRDGNHEIYLLDLTEQGEPRGEPRRITHHPAIDMHPTFSPDGEWLLFASDRSGEPDEITRSQMRFSPLPAGELWTLRLADRTLQRLTHDGWEDGLPEWGTVPR